MSSLALAMHTLHCNVASRPSVTSLAKVGEVVGGDEEEYFGREKGGEEHERRVVYRRSAALSRQQ